MPEFTREARRRIGAVLLRVASGEQNLPADDMPYAKALEGKGLVTVWRHPGASISAGHGAEAQLLQVQRAGMTHYILTGLGQAFILQSGEQRLKDGRFLLPGESPWYD